MNSRLTIPLAGLLAATPVAANPEIPLPTLHMFGADVLAAVEEAAANAPAPEGDWENEDARSEELTFEERHANSPLRNLNQDDDSVHYARGHTLVCHVFIDHDGGTWQQSERDAAGAKAQTAKNYYTMNAPPEAIVMFDNGWSNVYYSYNVTLPLNIMTDGMSNFFTELALGVLGFVDADGDGTFIDDASLYLQTVNGGFDNVIMVFEPADITGRAFASYEFARVIQYTDDLGSVWAHEWGHLFGSCDEYVEDGECGGGMDCGFCQSWYVNGLYVNGNCQLGSCPMDVDCLMIDNTFNGICDFTLGHWAWTDTDQDGQLDPTRRRVFATIFADVWELWHDGFFYWDEAGGSMAIHQTDPSWSVVGLRNPPGGDFNLHLFGDNNYEHHYASSQFSASQIDFVVGDYNHNNLGIDHVLVTETFNFGTDYSLHWESGTQMLYADGLVSTESWNADKVVRVWDVPLEGGENVKFTLTPSSGLDMGMALFASNGGSYWVGRANSVWEADANGIALPETYSFQVPGDDVYGLVVWSNNAASGSFEIQIGPTPLTMVEEAPYASSQALALYNYVPNAASWSVVGTRPGAGSNNQIAIYGDKNYLNEVERSRDYAGGVEYIVTDHNVVPDERRYVRVSRDSGGGTAMTVWEHDADYETGIVGGNWPSSGVVKIWDASAEANQEYFLRGYHNTLDTGLYLYESIPFYQARADFAAAGNINPPSVGGEWFSYISPTAQRVGIVQVTNTPSSDSYQNWWGPRFGMSNDVALTRQDQVVWGIHSVPGGYWNVFAARDSTTSGNISLYGNEGCSLAELKATDQSSTSTVTYVVGDFNHSPTGTYYTRAWHDGETDLDLEWEGGNETLAEVHGQVVEWAQTWPEGDVAEVFDLWLYEDADVGPHSIHVEVVPLTDDLDLDVALFMSDNATFFGNPTNAVAKSANEGPGQMESFEHSVRISDWYGLVVTCRGDRGGDYIIRIGPAEAVAAGEPSAAPEFSFAASPNPFRGSSTLAFSLEREQAVDLVVFDVAGRMVRRVASGPLPAGHHSRTWDGRDGFGRRVAAGVYLVRLQTNDAVSTRKLIRLP